MVSLMPGFTWCCQIAMTKSHSSASVFIKYAPNAQLDNYTPQIKRLINNSIVGLDYDRISVALIPGNEILPSNTFSQDKHFLGIEVNENSYNKFIILVSLLIFYLLALIYCNICLIKGNRNKIC